MKPRRWVDGYGPHALVEADEIEYVCDPQFRLLYATRLGLPAIVVGRDPMLKVVNELQLVLSGAGVPPTGGMV
jgi:hypothetical protein